MELFVCVDPAPTVVGPFELLESVVAAAIEDVELILVVDDVIRELIVAVVLVSFGSSDVEVAAEVIIGTVEDIVDTFSVVVKLVGVVVGKVERVLVVAEVALVVTVEFVVGIVNNFLVVGEIAEVSGTKVEIVDRVLVVPFSVPVAGDRGVREVAAPVVAVGVKVMVDRVSVVTGKLLVGITGVVVFKSTDVSLVIKAVVFTTFVDVLAGVFVEGGGLSVWKMSFRIVRNKLFQNTFLNYFSNKLCMNKILTYDN